MVVQTNVSLAAAKEEDVSRLLKESRTSSEGVQKRSAASEKTSNGPFKEADDIQSPPTSIWQRIWQWVQSILFKLIGVPSK